MSASTETLAGRIAAAEKRRAARVATIAAKAPEIEAFVADVVAESGHGREFVRADELAMIFAVNKSTISRWTREGLLKGYRTPGSRLVLYDVRQAAADIQCASVAVIETKENE